MSLAIRPHETPARAGSPTWLDMLGRLTPSEVIAPYLCLSTLAPERRAVALSLLATGALATVAVLAWSVRKSRRAAPAGQYIVRVLSFLAWAFAVANPLAPDSSVAPVIPAIAILLIPLFGSAMLLPPSRAP